MGPTLPVEIVRSARRKRTVEAQIINGTIRVRVPARMKQSEVDRYTAELVVRLQRAEASDGLWFLPLCRFGRFIFRSFSPIRAL